ncbi:MAG: hypothetical protein SVU32_07490 [Candidatus Nanohaloarchaea archaeon]|nr:hypothetical protein [Candidatus Nanohaloarchaea archaeon]
MQPQQLKEQLGQCDPERIEFHQHAHERARQRNINLTAVREQVKAFEFVSVRENQQSDPRYKHSYKVTVTVEGTRYEMPIYFNVPGTTVLVKSIWRR